MSSDQLAGIVRAVVAGIGGYFVAKGSLSADVVAQVAGALAVLATSILSVISKKKV